MAIHILSIDENDMVSELDRIAYKKTGFNVIPANGYSEIEEVLKKTSVDVITINMDSKRYDSIGLIQYLKSNPQTKQIPLVAASVQTGFVRKQALNAGVDLFIEQPIPRHYYIEKVKKLLEQATRTTDRIQLNFSADIADKKGVVTNVEVVDVSPSGVLMQLQANVGDVHEIRLNLPGFKRQLFIKAEVVRTIPGAQGEQPKCALKFLDISNEAKRRIEKFVLTHKNEGELKFYI